MAKGILSFSVALPPHFYASAYDPPLSRSAPTPDDVALPFAVLPCRNPTTQLFFPSRWTRLSLDCRTYRWPRL
ncbi:hypothetical protein BDZ89DRAFT_223783 [Hymenopellis radicata]|nr:hypothetical protein BDZ89DRAFT_223783 [Hymenopellis radicata]